MAGNFLCQMQFQPIFLLNYTMSFKIPEIRYTQIFPLFTASCNCAVFKLKTHIMSHGFGNDKEKEIKIWNISRKYKMF
jgi:hypothetical protein